jgi:hypothetical protein
MLQSLTVDIQRGALMVWYASQIYAQPTPDVRALFAAHLTLSQGMYLLNHLEGHQWPEGDFARYWFPHGLPTEGLLVVRELCAPGTMEFDWHKPRASALSWEDVIGPSNMRVLRLNHLPSAEVGKIFFDSAWAGVHPPSPFLKFLKDVSRTTGTVISFYHHASRAEKTALQELAWVFGEDECVYAGLTPDYGKVTKFTPIGATEFGTTRDRKTVLQYVLGHFGLELPSTYFAPHTRDFVWEQYKL